MIFNDYFNKLLYESPFAWWEWEISSNRVIFNDLKAVMLGYDPARFYNKGFEQFTALLHADDYTKAMDAMLAVIHRKTNLYQVDYRILAASGNYHWYMDRGTVIEKSPDGTPLKLRGIVIDLGKEGQAGSSSNAILHLLEKSSGINADFLLTICSNCGRAKLEDFTWIAITDDLKKNIANGISHGICPDCIRTLYPDMAEEIFAFVEKKRQ